MSEAVQFLIGLPTAMLIAWAFYRLGYRDGRKRERFEQAAKPLGNLDRTTKP